MNSTTSLIFGAVVIVLYATSTPRVHGFVRNHDFKHQGFVVQQHAENAPAPFSMHQRTEKHNRVSLAMVATTAPTGGLASGGQDQAAKNGGIDKELASIYRNADVIFSVIDIDGNGFLSRQELTSHLTTAGYQAKIVNQIFSKMDINSDGKVSREEFRRGMETLPALQQAPGLGAFNMPHYKREILQDADQAFQSADADGNGALDEFEFKSHLGRMFGRGYSEKAIQELFKSLDVNGDEKISKKEFRDAFLKCAALRQVIGEGPNYK